MKPINVTGRAAKDLKEIARYTRDRWGGAQMERYLAEIEALFHRLRSTPELGKERRDIDRNLRSFPVRSHVIYYRVTGRDIVIVRILHQGMLPVRHLELIENSNDE